MLCRCSGAKHGARLQGLQKVISLGLCTRYYNQKPKILQCVFIPVNWNEDTYAQQLVSRNHIVSTGGKTE